MPNWWGGWVALFLVIFIAAFIAYGIYDTIKSNLDCRYRGGVMTRAGCLKPEVFK